MTQPPARSNATPPTQHAPRYAYWLDRSERQIRCPRNHDFTPDLRLHAGRADVTCHHGGTPEQRCGALLLVLIVPQYTKRLIAEVSRADLEYMQQQGWPPEAELAYLLSTPVKRAVDSANG